MMRRGCWLLALIAGMIALMLFGIALYLIVWPFLMS